MAQRLFFFNWNKETAQIFTVLKVYRSKEIENLWYRIAMRNFVRTCK